MTEIEKAEKAKERVINRPIIMDLAAVVKCLQCADGRRYTSFCEEYTLDEIAIAVLSLPQKIILLNGEYMIAKSIFTRLEEILPGTKNLGKKIELKQATGKERTVFDIITPKMIHDDVKTIIFIQSGFISITEPYERGLIEERCTLHYPEIDGLNGHETCEFLYDGFEMLLKVIKYYKNML